MKTLYAACLSRLGLSQTAAASLHNVSLDTIKKWSSGKIAVPAGIWGELRSYEAQIVDSSEELRERWEAAGSPPIELDDSNAGPAALIAAADFLLTTDAPVLVQATAARHHIEQYYPGYSEN